MKKQLWVFAASALLLSGCDGSPISTSNADELTIERIQADLLGQNLWPCERVDGTIYDRGGWSFDNVGEFEGFEIIDRTDGEFVRERRISAMMQGSNRTYDAVFLVSYRKTDDVWSLATVTNEECRWWPRQPVGTP